MGPLPLRGQAYFTRQVILCTKYMCINVVCVRVRVTCTCMHVSIKPKSGVLVSKS